jgi:hypothetical protein
MKTKTRVFQKEALILTQGQYEEPTKSGGALRLLRWRVVVDGVEGPWRKAEPGKSNGGWAEVMPDLAKKAPVKKKPTK